jgi:hypothetical protein
MDNMKEVEWTRVARAKVGIDGEEVGAEGCGVRHAACYEGLGKLEEVVK